jgi:Ca-activated chloride channel family protein
VTTEIAPTPWNQKTLLLHIGIKGYNMPKDNLPPANLEPV